MSRGRDALTWLPSEPAASEWFDQSDRFRVGDVEFHCSFQVGSKANRFFIRKHRRLIEQYLDAFDDFPHANVVELGIAEGGSVALIALVTPPKKLVALELDEKRVDALDELIGRLTLTERVRPYYGVDQADRARLGAIIDDEFGDEPLDLVIRRCVASPRRDPHLLRDALPKAASRWPLPDRGLESAALQPGAGGGAGLP